MSDKNKHIKSYLRKLIPHIHPHLYFEGGPSITVDFDLLAYVYRALNPIHFKQGRTPKCYIKTPAFNYTARELSRCSHSKNVPTYSQREVMRKVRAQGGKICRSTYITYINLLSLYDIFEPLPGGRNGRWCIYLGDEHPSHYQRILKADYRKRERKDRIANCAKYEEALQEMKANCDTVEQFQDRVACFINDHIAVYGKDSNKYKKIISSINKEAKYTVKTWNTVGKRKKHWFFKDGTGDSKSA